MFAVAQRFMPSPAFRIVLVSVMSLPVRFELLPVLIAECGHINKNVIIMPSLKIHVKRLPDFSFPDSAIAFPLGTCKCQFLPDAFLDKDVFNGHAAEAVIGVDLRIEFQNNCRIFDFISPTAFDQQIIGGVRKMFPQNLTGRRIVRRKTKWI